MTCRTISRITPGRVCRAAGVAGCLLWQTRAFSETAKVPPVATGANVDESHVQLVLSVDAANSEAADDDKHGTADAPFATVSFACRMAERAKDANRGVKVLIAAGTYRESVEIHPPANGKPDTDAPLVIEAAEHDQTVIDGADIEGWTPSTWTVEDGRWTHPWPFLRAAAKPAPTAGGPPPAGAAAASYRHGDMVFVDGVPLRQAGALADLLPGSFWGRAPAPAAGGRRGKVAATVEPAGGAPVVFVQPPAETELANCIIQVGARPHGLLIAGRRNVVVRGLLFEHAAAPAAAANDAGAAAGLRFEDCANVLVEDVLSQWNDGAGLEITGRGAGTADWTLRRVRLLHNGGAGLAVDGVRNLLAEDGEASFNNFRGDWTGLIDAQSLAAIKVSRADGSTWRRQRAVSNACRGMWFAAGTNLTVEEAVVRDCLVSGLLIDEARGPTLVRRGLVVGTRAPSGEAGNNDNPAAVSIFGSGNVTLESCIVAMNAVPALGLGNALPSAGSGLHVTVRPPVQPPAQHTYRHNVFSGQDAGQTLVDWPTAERAGAMDFTAFFRTLDLEENCFWNPESADVFGGYDKAGRRGPGVAFEAWAASLAARAGGGGRAPAAASNRWQDPGFVGPAEGDFRLREDSALKDWGLPGEENAAGQ